MARIVQNLAYLGVSVVGAGDHAVVVKDAHPAMMTRNLWERAYTVRNEEAVTVAQRWSLTTGPMLCHGTEPSISLRCKGMNIASELSCSASRAKARALGSTRSRAM